MTKTVVEGPVEGGRHGWPFGAYVGDIGDRGYIEHEFFVSGRATRFVAAGPLTPDGRWSVLPSDTGDYRTRVLVRRPVSVEAFNGTVVVEWSNVSKGFDIAFADPPGIYNGFAYVSISAQRVGVHGYPTNPCGLLHWDPERYGTLSIPDDALSYDIYTQVARLLKFAPATAAGPALLGDLQALRLIAIGGSQAGNRIIAYTNGVQPRERVFDALMPLVCAGMAADFGPEPTHLQPAAKHARRSVYHTRVRGDLEVPVMEVNSETEALHYYPMRQPDTDLFRYWEIPGSSHAPAGQIALIRRHTDRDGVPGPGNTAMRVSEVMWLPTVDAAIRHVHDWLVHGTPPPRQPSITINGDPATIERDEHGNARGGIRLPELEVPTATYQGMTENSFLGGTTQPFPPDKLRRLYPTHQTYVDMVTSAANAAANSGVIRPQRATEYIEAARSAPVPR